MTSPIGVSQSVVIILGMINLLIHIDNFLPLMLWELSTDATNCELRFLP